jgi:hypothetical protein
MKPERAVLVERSVLIAGFVGMSVALAAFDWRIGLFVFSLLLSGSALNIPARRP